MLAVVSGYTCSTPRLCSQLKQFWLHRLCLYSLTKLLFWSCIFRSPFEAHPAQDVVRQFAQARTVRVSNSCWHRPLIEHIPTRIPLCPPRILPDVTLPLWNYLLGMRGQLCKVTDLTSHFQDSGYGVISPIKAPCPVCKNWLAMCGRCVRRPLAAASAVYKVIISVYSSWSTVHSYLLVWFRMLWD